MNCKQNKIWIDKGNEFYNRSKKSRYNIMIYSDSFDTQ